MVVVRFSSVLPASRAAVWSFVGDFANIERWDPGVKSSVKASAGPAAVGTAYDLVTVFNGKESAMRYVVREVVPQSKLVVYGESSTVTGLDTITFADAPNNCTRVEYEADIRLKGVLALATWWVTPDLKKLAAEAKSGLEAAWAGGKQNAAPAGAGGEQAGAKGSEGGSG